MQTLAGTVGELPLINISDKINDNGVSETKATAFISTEPSVARNLRAFTSMLLIPLTLHNTGYFFLFDNST